MGAKDSTQVHGSREAETIEDIVGQLIGGLEAGRRLDGPYSARLFESNGSVQTTIPKVARNRLTVDLDDLGARDQYVEPESGLLIIDLEGEFNR